MTPKPKRACNLDLHIGGDTKQDIISHLRNLLFEFETTGISISSVSGSPSSHHTLSYSEDLTITHDVYFEQVDKYLDELAKEGAQ